MIGKYNNKKELFMNINTKQLTLFPLLLCATSGITMHAMENQMITFAAAQMYFENSWKILSATPQYNVYKQAEARHTFYSSPNSGPILENIKKNMWECQENQDFIKWYVMIHTFPKYNFYKIRERSGSAPACLYKRT